MSVKLGNRPGDRSPNRQFIDRLLRNPDGQLDLGKVLPRLSNGV